MIHNYAEKYLGIGESGKLGLMNFYNENCAQYVKPSRRYHIKNGDNWCAMFTTVMACMYGVTAYDFPYEVSVGEQVKISLDRGLYTSVKREYAPDDLIVFDWQGVNGWPDHVGFIKSVENGIITTIEGNYKGTVGTRIIDINSRFINGVIKIR